MGTMMSRWYPPWWKDGPSESAGDSITVSLHREAPREPWNEGLEIKFKIDRMAIPNSPAYEVARRMVRVGLR
jgi:hypothetical protein